MQSNKNKKFCDLYQDLYHKIVIFNKRSSIRQFKDALRQALTEGMAIDFRPDNLRTLLYSAIMLNCIGNEKTRIIGTLLEAGAGIDYKDKQVFSRNALQQMLLMLDTHVSADDLPKYLKLLEEVIKRTKNINYESTQHETAFSIAFDKYISTGNSYFLDIIPKLIKAGAVAKISNTMKKRAQQFSQEQRLDQIKNAIISVEDLKASNMSEYDYEL